MHRTPVRRTTTTAIAVAIVSLTAASCDEVVVEPVPVADVTVTPGSVTLDVGATRRFQATATDVSGNRLPRPVSWRSGNPAIATVDGEGLATAMGAGTVSIIATIGSTSGSASVQVSPTPVVSLEPVFVTLTARRNGLISEGVDVAVSNAGGGTLTGISVTVDYDDNGSGWLEASVEQSTAPTILTLRGDPSELDVGTYSAQVTVSGTPPVSPAVLTVTFQVVSSPPERPDELDATPLSGTEARLDWRDRSDNEETFRIERRASIFAPYAEVGVVGADVTTFTDASLSPGTRYAFRIRACNAAGCSDYEGPVEVTTLSVQSAPTAPDGLVASATSSSEIVLEWTDNASNEDEFRVERRLDTGDAFELVGGTGADVTTFTDDGLESGTTYVYRVQACNTVGCSEFSAEASATTPAPSPPEPPSGLTAEGISSSQIRLEWIDNADNETRFEVQRRRGQGGGGWDTVATVGTDVTTYVDGGLQKGTGYGYRVRACNDVGCSSYTSRVDASTFDE
ncbi:MAG TPA: fibronectin type III domain-containing protein [Longimicrobiales bacterium]|nr:fibronectin type III domain-containing protein [Longimicrobiales bacterium]